jgi:hypothetical protein
MRRASSPPRLWPILIVLVLVAALTALTRHDSRADRRGDRAPPALALPTSTPTAPVSAGEGADRSTSTTLPAPSAAGGAPSPSAGGASPAPADRSDRTLLEIEVTSDATWATVEVPGVAVLAQRAPRTQGDLAVAAVGSSTAAMAVRGHGTANLRLVGEVVGGSPVPVRTCKSPTGSLSVRVIRATGSPVTVAAVTNRGTAGQTTAGCENGVHTAVPREDLLGPTAWPPRLDDRRLVLSSYYPWYDEQTFTSGSWQNHPSRPWNTDDAGEVTEMVALARKAGIDGFLVSYNHHPATARRFDHVLSAAQRQGDFFVGPLLELGFLAQQQGSTTVGADALEAWARAVLARSSSPAWLRADGRPVLVLYGVDSLPAEVWAEVRRRLLADGLDPFVLGETTAPAYGFDGLYQYSPNVEPDGDGLPAWYRRFEREARLDPLLHGTGHQVLWAAPVSPGQDDSLVRGAAGGALVVDRRGGARYDDTWSAALDTRPDWVLVTSWNEFYENTEIAPSRAHGLAPLEQTASWADRFSPPSSRSSTETK